MAILIQLYSHITQTGRNLLTSMLLILGDVLHGCLPETSMAQGSSLHLWSDHRRMASGTHRFRQLLESHRHLRGRERPAYIEKCSSLRHLPGQFMFFLFSYPVSSYLTVNSSGLARLHVVSQLLLRRSKSPPLARPKQTLVSN